MKNNILWIRNDLRFEDNTALIKAVESSYNDNINLIIIFHINIEQIKIATFSNDYFFSALNVFYNKVKSIGGDILFLYGNVEEAFQQLFDKNIEINKVFFNYSERGYSLKRDKKAISILEKNNVDICCFLDKHLHGANEVLNSEDSHYKIFTAYYKKWSKLNKKNILEFNFDKFKKVINNDFSNVYKDEYNKIIENIKYNFESSCGEDIALEKLKEFIDFNLSTYQENRDNIFSNSNSSMSKFLSTGQISIRKVYYSVLEIEYTNSVECFIKQLAWRDFYNMTYHYNPKQENEEMIEKYRDINWNYDEYAFNIWKYGITGFPIVDAAMRELVRTGEMHNRLRMITASFLVKDLLVDWRIGESYFKEMLIDYDSASNIGSWQWVASTGSDSCPYFRIFNPSTQSKRFDANALYIKSVIYELSDLEIKYIHEPYKIKEVDIDYPKPIVEHKVQRLKTLDMYRNKYQYLSNFKDEFIKRYILFEFNKIKNASKKELIEFHSNNKYLYFTYSIELKDALGKILAKKMKYYKLYDDYKIVLFELLNEKPSAGKTINAYEHIYGYFKKILNEDEKDEYKNLVLKYSKCDTLDDFLLKKFFIKLADKYDVLYIRKQTLLI